MDNKILIEVATDSLNCLNAVHNARAIIARVVARNEETGIPEIYFIASGEAPNVTNGLKIASYRAPIGALASWPVGEEGTICTPREEKNFSIECKAIINAKRSPEINSAHPWDSKNTIVSHVSHSEVTIRSLLKFVHEVENRENIDQVSEGINRYAITEFALRSQPILDRTQDRIFRLPTSARIFLSGRPGSGKTTTLIRRLGQKTDIPALEASQENVKIFSEIEREYKIDHKKNWYFFSPTRPLGIYLASAIEREGLVGGVECVKVWDDYSKEIAGELGLIKTQNNPGIFHIKEYEDSCSDFNTDTSLFDSFWNYYVSSIRQSLSDVATRWSRSETDEVAAIGRRFLHFIAQNTRLASLLQEQSTVISQLNNLDNGLLRGAPVNRSDWIAYIGKTYKKFREDEAYGNLIKSSNDTQKSEISKREMDILLLTYLRAANELLEHFDANGLLKKIKDRRRVQIFVDEATDFSVIQLSCMYELCHPKVRSFFLCGDLNQRFAGGGIRDMKELKWISKDFELLEVSRNYRQTEILSTLANHIIASPRGIVYGSEFSDNKKHDVGFRPVWSDNLSSRDCVVKWLVGRISEITEISDEAAAIAVFVNSEDEVDCLAKAISERSAKIKRGVAPCIGGRVSGSSSDIRIFDVRHIRGLEFEAAFFIGVDELINIEPNNFLNFLYVGATRAATFFGMTFSGDVPDQLKFLDNYFGNSWSQ